MTTLSEILKDFPLKERVELPLDTPITSITSDSREVKAGGIFVAIKGEKQDGHDFVPRVQEQGAALIVGERPLSSLAPYLQVEDSREALACLAASFYKKPSHSMLMIGVTGTSGKTTTTYLIESILSAAGHRVGVIGTVNFRFGAKIYPSTHTTPGAVELQKLLAEMRADGCTAVVMEVSSHALKQSRAAFIAWDVMVFSNLSPEHLDFHPDMEDYYRSKAILFTHAVHYSQSVGKKPLAVINGEDLFGKRLATEARTSSSRVYDLNSVKFTIDLEGVRGNFYGIPIESKLVGRFNASNLLAAVTVAHGLGLDPKMTSQGVSHLKAVPGRLEKVPNTQGIHVLIDYAHKSDALEKVLKTLRELCQGHRLITVFGCGGDRDRTKRPVMGKLAVENSDQVWVTSDNPRTEDPQAIINEILVGTQGFSSVMVEPDRRKAITEALKGAQRGDIVLIAGKGHEDYQILGTRKIHFDDREVAAEALAQRSIQR